MKSFLVFLLAMGSIVTLGDADCFGALRNRDWPSRGCMMNGKLYPFGHIERTEFCYQCSCDKYSMYCCSLFHSATHYDRENCKVIFNRERCDYDVVPKHDPSKVCSFSFRVG